MATIFKLVETEDDIRITVAIAEETWTEYYTPIIGKEQVDYMLKTYQSEEAIKKQITNEGYRYYLIELNGTPAGYFGIKDEGTYLFLSKLYVMREFRKHKLASNALVFIKTLTRKKSVRLTVNKNNTASINVYHHWGFKEIDTIVTNI